MRKAKSSERRTVAIRCIAFVLLFSMLFIYISYLFRPYWEGRNGFVGFYAEPKNRCDVVYIGGSVCVECWAPFVAWEEQGFTSYAFGMSSLQSPAVKLLLDEMYKRQSPELVVFDLRPFQYTGEHRFQEADVRWTTDVVPYSWNRLVLVHTLLQDIPEVAQGSRISYYADLFRYHSNWQYLIDKSFKNSIAGLSPSATKGFHFITDPPVPLTMTDHSQITETAPVSALAEKNLRALLAYLATAGGGQRAIFVVTPYQESAHERAQYNYLRAIIEEEGFAYWNANDYNAEIGIDPEQDFYHYAHTNLYGAEKYTAYLARYLADAYALPDHRNDPSYADWTTDYEVWVDLADDCKNAMMENTTKEAEGSTDAK